MLVWPLHLFTENIKTTSRHMNCIVVFVVVLLHAILQFEAYILF